MRFFKLQKLSKLRTNIKKDYKKILTNYFYLTIIQALNYLLPFITFPYLVRVLGIEKFGLIAFANAATSYFVIIADYGFNLTAPYEITINKNNRNKLIEIFSSILTIKFLLSTLSFVILCLLIFSLPKFKCNALLYIFSFGTVLGTVIFPVWFFQGIEEMRYIALLDFISKLLSTISIFIFIKQSSDFLLVPILNSMGAITSGIMGIVIIKIKFKVYFKIPHKKIIKKNLINGWNIFISRVYVNLYTSTNILILGFMTNNTIVGSYSVAEKIINAFNKVFQPASQALYPFMANLYSNKNSFFIYFKKICMLFGLLTFLFFFLLKLFNIEIVTIVNGRMNTEISSILSILTFSIFFSPYGSFLTQTLVILKKNKTLNKIFLIAFLYNSIVVPTAIFFISASGMAYAVVSVQILIISLCFLEIRKGAN